MSGSRHDSKRAGDVDRRQRKTQAALLDAFSGLVLGRRYDEIKVGDIVEQADVGRSTFYEHYRGKDDLLVDSMGHLLDAFAGAALEAKDGEALDWVVRHFWENRDVARYLLCGPPARDVVPRIVRALAERIETGLSARLQARGGEAVIPPKLIATQVAEAQFGLIRAWLAGRAPCAPEELAAGLRRSAAASIAALITPETNAGAMTRPT